MKTIDAAQALERAIDALRAEALSFTRAARSIQIFLSDLQGLGD